MDIAAVVLGISGIGSVGVGVAIGRQMTIRRDILALSRTVHEITLWSTSVLPREYVQKDALALTLAPIVATLSRIETHLETHAAEDRAVFADIRSHLALVTRWIDQHGGSISS